jgi:hypothetical protein
MRTVDARRRLVWPADGRSQSLAALLRLLVHCGEPAPSRTFKNSGRVR